VLSWGALKQVLQHCCRETELCASARPEVSSNAAFNLTPSVQCPHPTSTLNVLMCVCVCVCVLTAHYILSIQEAEAGWTVVACTFNLSTQEAETGRSP